MLVDHQRELLIDRQPLVWVLVVLKYCPQVVHYPLLPELLLTLLIDRPPLVNQNHTILWDMAR